MSIVIQHSIISGGTFIRSGDNDASFSITKGFEILHGRIAPDAFHNSADRFDAPKCHPDTRLAVLDDIMRWVQDLAQSKVVLWLYGPAGAGKSAIAQTIAELCAKLGLLVASFFFFRTSPSRNNEKHLVASIVYQLALSIPETRPFIDSAIQIDPSIFDKSMETQVETLIIVPLEKAWSNATPGIADKWPRLILIDGLDECNGDSIQRSIIHTLSTALLRHRVPLILFVASRPEPHIRNAFNAFDISHSSHHIVLDNSYNPDADIKKFLLSRFKEIKENHPLTTFIPESWPPAEIINRFVQKSSGQFIYASTVMKYLDSPKHDPTKRLDAIVGLIPVGGDAPYKQLDTLYTHIFSCVEDIAGALRIIGFLLFGRAGNSSPKLLESLFDLDRGDLYLCLSDLHSILDIPPPSDNTFIKIRVFHASLGDFLVDKLRSGNYYLDETMVRTNIAQCCLTHLDTPVFKRSKNLLIAHRYSTRNFAYHCHRASTTSERLKVKLMQKDFYGYFSVNLVDYDILLFFEWLKEADKDGRLLSHVRQFWDRSLRHKLDKFLFRESGIELAVILIFPRQWAVSWLRFSGFPEYPDVLKHYLPEPSSSSYTRAIYHLFIDFFVDCNRSGKYHVNGNSFAHAALDCIQYIFNLEESGMTFKHQPFVTRSPDLRQITAQPFEINFASVLHSFATLLSMASPLNSLYSVLRDHWFDAGSKIAPYSASDEPELLNRFLKSAVETYLEKCDIEFRPKRRYGSIQGLNKSLRRLLS